MWHEEIMAEKISTMKMAFHHELLNQGYGSSIIEIYLICARYITNTGTWWSDISAQVTSEASHAC